MTDAIRDDFRRNWLVLTFLCVQTASVAYWAGGLSGKVNELDKTITQMQGNRYSSGDHKVYTSLVDQKFLAVDHRLSGVETDVREIKKEIRK